MCDQYYSLDNAAGSSTTTDPNLRNSISAEGLDHRSYLPTHPIYTGGGPAARKATSSGEG